MIHWPFVATDARQRQILPVDEDVRLMQSSVQVLRNIFLRIRMPSFATLSAWLRSCLWRSGKAFDPVRRMNERGFYENVTNVDARAGLSAFQRATGLQ